MDAPETRYAHTPDGLEIAYQVVGDGPRDIFYDPYMTCLDVMWDDPEFDHALRRLSSIGRLIMLEHRGVGSSDPVPLGALPTPEEWMDDIRVVLDEVGSKSATIVSQGGLGFYGMLFSASYPERTDALVLIEAYARTLAGDDYPGYPAEQVDELLVAQSEVWGTGAMVRFMAPSRARDDAFRRWHARRERAAMSRAMLVASLRWQVGFDVRDILPAIGSPTLILHRRHEQTVPIWAGKYLASRIPGARLVPLTNEDMFPFGETADEAIDVIEEFVTGAPPAREPERVLATVLFTDIVGSTEHAAAVGDKDWSRLLGRHNDIVDRCISEYRGRHIDSAGDGVLATFDGPARAIRCACAIRDGVEQLGIDIRAGLHTGEIELAGDDVRGIAVHIGARVSALAGAGEVLVSRTVTDLVAGSGLEFDARGEHELKGVPGNWAIYAVKR